VGLCQCGKVGAFDFHFSPFPPVRPLAKPKVHVNRFLPPSLPPSPSWPAQNILVAAQSEGRAARGGDCSVLKEGGREGGREGMHVRRADIMQKNRTALL